MTHAMRRIAVVGCGGAGKSRLSRALGATLGLPVIHLDREFWKPGWVESSDAEWDAKQSHLFAGDAWVSDGNFARTIGTRLARADTVIHLDMATWTCLRGAIGRVIRRRGEVREDMAPGCPEKWDLDFLRWIVRFRRDVRPGLLAALETFESRGGRVVTLRSRAEADAFLDGL